MVGFKIRVALLNYILLNQVSFTLSTLPECNELKEDFPSGILEYSRSLRGDLDVLGMALDELLPWSGHQYEVESVLTKARELMIENNWDRVSSRHYLERLASEDGKSKQGQPLVGAINLFHALKDCLYRCDYTSSLALAANYVAAFENELYPADDNRVKWTILKVIELHREKCLPNYLDRFQSAQSSLEPNAMQKLDTMFDSELLDKILRDKDIKSMSSIDINDQLLQRRSELYDRVAALAKGTEEAQYISAKRNGFNRLDYEVLPKFKSKTVAKHIIEPCRRFVRQFRDIFYPMRLDLILMSSSVIRETEASSEDLPTKNPELMNFWTKYRLCRELSNDRVRFADLIAGEVPEKLGLIGREVQTPAPN